MHRTLHLAALLLLQQTCALRVVATRRAALALPAAAIAWPALAEDEPPFAAAAALAGDAAPPAAVAAAAPAPAAVLDEATAAAAAPSGVTEAAIEPPAAEPAPPPAPTGPTAFDFDVPFRGEPKDIDPFLGKASVVVNVKFDDPISTDMVPALNTLLEKYKANGLHVLAFPTDQGWFEAEDSNTLRLKFKSVFDFGSFPTAVVFDKSDLLGTNALPLYRWLTNTLANPWGVNRIVFNYEKFLLDDKGVPLRRYPRKFPVSLMETDVQAVLAGKPLPPPSARLVQAWEDAKREAIKSEYAFKPGLNYYKKGSPAS